MMSSDVRTVTATMLRDLVICERRVRHDLHANLAARDRTSPFVELLWAGGVAHEAAVLGDLEGVVVDLREVEPAERIAATMTTLRRNDVDHVLGAVLGDDDLVGRPDVVSRVDGRFVAGDVKAGTPFMPDGRRVRLEYGVQIGLYAHLLARSGLGDGERAFVIGTDGVRAIFDLIAPWGDTTVTSLVEELVARARRIRDDVETTRGAASAGCGLCHWRSLCRGELEAADDPTLLAEVGRDVRFRLEAFARTRAALAALDVDALARAGGRTAVPGIGAARLRRFRDRARLQGAADPRPYARRPLGLLRAPLEWHFDIEADPTRDHVYLHGVHERRLDPEGCETTRFIHFFAESDDDEEEAFAGCWAFLNSDPDAMIYYYSPYERTAYRRLQRRYPQVCSAEEIERFFASAGVVDLYTEVVRPWTEWPTGSYGIKAIAKLQGFSWAAEDASGASSIAWYDEYRRTGDAALRDRIIDYNRSDCVASAVVLDALIALPVVLT